MVQVLSYQRSEGQRQGHNSKFWFVNKQDVEFNLQHHGSPGESPRLAATLISDPEPDQTRGRVSMNTNQERRERKTGGEREI